MLRTRRHKLLQVLLFAFILFAFIWWQLLFGLLFNSLLYLFVDAMLLFLIFIICFNNLLLLLLFFFTFVCGRFLVDLSLSLYSFLFHKRFSSWFFCFLFPFCFLARRCVVSSVFGLSIWVWHSYFYLVVYGLYCIWIALILFARFRLLFCLHPPLKQRQ